MNVSILFNIDFFLDIPLRIIYNTTYFSLKIKKIRKIDGEDFQIFFKIHFTCQLLTNCLNGNFSTTRLLARHSMELSLYVKKVLFKAVLSIRNFEVIFIAFVSCNLKCHKSKFPYHKQFTSCYWSIQMYLMNARRSHFS